MNFRLQFLKSGVALCGKVFPDFVTTWNWLVRAVSNLKGDADVNDAQGRIKVDFTDPDHPIVRCVGCNGGGNGGGNGNDLSSKKAWDVVWLDEITDETGAVTQKKGYYFTHCYYSKGGVTSSHEDIRIDPPESSGSGDYSLPAHAVLCAKFRLYADEGDVSQDDEVEAVVYSALAEATAAQLDDHYYIVPLYVAESGVERSGWIDLRTMANIQVFEGI